MRRDCGRRLIVTVLPLFAGCATLALAPMTSAPLLSGAGDAGGPSAAATAGPDDWDAATAALPSGASGLSGDHWIESSAFDPGVRLLSTGFRTEAAEFRWRFAAADSRAWTGDELRAVARLAGSDGRNAAILQSRRGGLATVDRVRRVAEDESQPPRVRCAAVEGWSVQLIGAPEPEWSGIAALASASEPLVRAEAMRSLGRGVEPQRVPAVAAAAADWDRQTREVRRAIVDACVLYASRVNAKPTAWPAGIAAARYDRDAFVRRNYGRLLAAARTPDAFEVLSAQARDIDAGVRTSAVVSLGVLGSDEAVERLKRLASDPGERTRAAAAEGLAAAGVPNRGDDDAAAVVREAAALAAADRLESSAGATLMRLVGDADRTVQAAAVRAVETWGDREAVPVLLAALEQSTFSVRRSALKAIRLRTGVGEPFALEAGVEVRRVAVEDWRVRFGLPRATPRTVEWAEPRGDVTWAVHALASAESHPEATATLRGLTEPAVPALEAAVTSLPDRGRSLWSTPLWTEVLPSLRGDFAAAASMASDDGAERVAGAEALAAFAADRTPSPLVLDRLPDLMSGQQNARSWRAAVSAVAGDAAGGPAARLYTMAVVSPWPDVRRAACEAVGQSGGPGLATLLRPAFADADAGVRAAAAEAAGRCGNPAALAGDGTTPGLRQLWHDNSPAVRKAAVAAAARLGDADASADLLRQCRHPDVTVRRDAAEALAASASEDHSPALLQLVWSEKDGETRGALSGGLARLVPPQGSTDDERLAHWAAVIGAGDGSRRLNGTRPE